MASKSVAGIIPTCADNDHHFAALLPQAIPVKKGWPSYGTILFETKTGCGGDQTEVLFDVSFDLPFRRHPQSRLPPVPWFPGLA